MSDKAKEKELLEQLFEIDGYFAEYFKKDLDTMLYNITNDFPIEMDTVFNSAAAEATRQMKEQAQKHREKVDSLCETLLCVHVHGNEDGRAKERAVQELGLGRVIQLKRMMGLEWDNEDKEYLTKLLDLNH